MYCPNPDCRHLHATGDPAEYLGGITDCHDCGSPLVQVRPAWPAERWEFEEFAPVLEIRGAGLVPVVESLLRSAEIRYFIKGERVQDLFAWGRLGLGYSVVTGPPVVYVEPGRAEEARELLEEVAVVEDDALPPEEAS